MCGSWERINSCIENLSSLANALGQISVRCFMNVPATIARISSLVRIVFPFTSYCNLSVFLRPFHISISSGFDFDFSCSQYMRPPYPIYLSAFIQRNYRKWMHVLLFTHPNTRSSHTFIETKHSSAAERRLLWMEIVFVTQCNHQNRSEKICFPKIRSAPQRNADYFIKCFCVLRIKCCFIHEPNSIYRYIFARRTKQVRTNHQDQKWQWLFWTFSFFSFFKSRKLNVHVFIWSN